MAEKEKDQLIIKRIINADIYLILDTAVIKALNTDHPIDFIVHAKKDLVTLRQATESGGEVRFRLIKEREEEKKDDLVFLNGE